MICPNCNSTIRDGSLFCNRCGAQIQNAPVEPVYQQQADNAHYQQPDNAYYPQQDNAYYQQQADNNAYYSQPDNAYYYADPAPAQVNAVAAPDSEPPVKVRTYIGWFILSSFSFLLVPFIIMIVFAADGRHKNRANFFRAQFALIGICLLVAVVIAIIIIALGGAGIVALGSF